MCSQWLYPHMGGVPFFPMGFVWAQNCTPECTEHVALKKCMLYVSVPQFDTHNEDKTVVYSLNIGERGQVVQRTVGSFDSADPLPIRSREWILRKAKLNTKIVRTLGINAWDSRSYIGNLGAEDDTLDGWMVAGARNFERSFADMPNTSYMHNVAILLPGKIPVV